MGMRIAVIGAGAAGLMATASILATSPDAEVVLLERNDGLGKKVIISGGGRCNVTTGVTDVRQLLTKYPRGGKFLTQAMYHFPPAAVYEWFESHGVPLKMQEDLRAFPQSDDGHDIVRVFEQWFRREARVTVRRNAQVVRVEKHPSGFNVSVRGDEDPMLVDRLILTTGGQAYRATGSTGDGYAFAQSLAHTITSLAPSLNAFFTQEIWPKELSGLSFEQATFRCDRDKRFTFTGPFLFTHKGVSGPAVFALSSLVAFEKYDATSPLAITIDLFPNHTVENLVETIVVDAQTNKAFVNTLTVFVARSLCEVACRELGFPLERKTKEVAKRDLLRAVHWLKAIPLHVIARGAGDEFVTAGGVNLDEVNPSTMESKISPGLYFAGEILNVDGLTGGFNLQASWATGRLAGESAST
jgi:predicted Rossmann fold flavoprotein